MKRSLFTVASLIVCTLAMGQSAEELNQKGETAYDRQDYATAVQMWTESATQGYAQAQFHLGVCYYNGQGVAQSYEKAAEWWRQAAAQEDEFSKRALENLNKWAEDIYLKGEAAYAHQDYTAAVQFWTDAVSKGHLQAQYRLGECYANGLGVTQSEEKAKEWYSSYATAQSNAEASYRNGQSITKPLITNVVFDYDKANRLVTDLNKSRKTNKLPPVSMERDLTEAAMLRAAELSTQIIFEAMEDQAVMDDHRRPNGAPFYTIVEEHYAYKKFDSENFEETIMYGVASDTWWIGQREAIVQRISRKWTTIGIGVCYTDGIMFVAVLCTMSGNGNTDAPTGLWDARLQVDTVSNGTTKLLCKTATDSSHLCKSIVITGDFLYKPAAELAVLVNNDRRAENLPALTLDSALTHAAMLRAAELSTQYFWISTATQKHDSNYPEYRKKDALMASSFVAWVSYVHVRPNFQNYKSIFTDKNYHGENAAWGGWSKMEDVEKALMNSPGHREAILHPRAKLMGVGVFHIPGECPSIIQCFSDGKLTKKQQSKSPMTVTVQISLDPEAPTKVLKKKPLK